MTWNLPEGTTLNSTDRFIYSVLWTSMMWKLSSECDDGDDINFRMDGAYPLNHSSHLPAHIKISVSCYIAKCLLVDDGQEPYDLTAVLEEMMVRPYSVFLNDCILDTELFDLGIDSRHVFNIHLLRSLVSGVFEKLNRGLKPWDEDYHAVPKLRDMVRMEDEDLSEYACDRLWANLIWDEDWLMPVDYLQSGEVQKILGISPDYAADAIPFLFNFSEAIMREMPAIMIAELKKPIPPEFTVTRKRFDKTRRELLSFWEKYPNWDRFCDEMAQADVAHRVLSSTALAVAD
jgi:hypothetical protein